jgi:PAS domain S-box-containing protein
MTQKTNKTSKKITSNELLKKSEEDVILQSQRKYRSLHMSMMDGFVMVNMQGKIIDSNESFQKMIGYDADELRHLTYADITPNEWHAYEQQIVKEQILINGHSGVYMKQYRKKDGTVFPAELRTFLVRDEAGSNEGMWAIARDITERKQAEEAIRASEEKFRSIVESSPNAMHLYQIGENDQLVLIGANPSADKLTGISHALLYGLTIEQAFPNLASTGIPEMYKRVAKGELPPQSFEIKYEDARFSGFYYVHIFKTIPGCIAVDFIDITSRKQMEDDVRRSEIEYRDTLDSLPDWIYVVDEKCEIVMVNSILKEELRRNGMNPDCIGQELNQHFPFIYKQTLDGINHVFKTGEASLDEQKVEVNGRILHVEITNAPILKDGHVIKVVLMIRDRSKEKELDELRTKNIEQKEVLLREIHHRVKNNLAIVISLLNFQLNNNSNEELTRIIIDIQMRIRSMALIHEYLYRSENLDRIPLANYIESLSVIIMTAFSGHRIHMIHDLDPIDVSIETAVPMGLIINELLTNAFKYAFPKGAPGEIHIRLKKEDGEQCFLVVEDNGIGLPEDPSMDSEKSLGFYIVRILVEQLAGNIKIVREKGTSFQIRFMNVIPVSRNL